jgi:hypothetical protein
VFLDGRFASGHRGRRKAAAADSAGRRPVDPRAHARPVGRGLCARSLENSYCQFFCGEPSFCHKLPFDRSSLTHWRQRLGEDELVALFQEACR